MLSEKDLVFLGAIAIFVNMDRSKGDKHMDLAIECSQTMFDKIFSEDKEDK